MRKFPSLLALRTFEAAGRLESFSLAANELHLTPSAVSHQIRSLEAAFARPLFQRHNRRVELTADGRRLLAKLSHVFDLLESACAELKPAPSARSLAVHCAPSFASQWLGPRLPDFMHLHPSLAIRMTASADPVDLLRHEALDILIAYGAVPRQPGLVSEALGTERITALCAPAQAGLDPEADDLPLIESALSPVRWPDWFELNSLRAPPQRSRPSFDRGALAIAAAAQGVGIALESTRLAQAELAQGTLVEFGGGRFRAVQRELHLLCYRAADRDVPKIRSFRDWLIALSPPA